jgi:hypothetical protein
MTSPEGLRWLLEDGRWRRLGQEGYKYVREVHSPDKVITKLINRLKELSGQ